MSTQPKRIGCGSTCICSRQEQDGSRLIKKELKKELEQTNHLDRFRRAYALQAKLAKGTAPYIVKPVSAQLKSAPYYILCEDDGGETLDQVQFTQITDLLQAVEGAARALHTLHKKGLLYLDVKANNFLRCQEGQIKLFDFDSVLDLKHPEYGMPLYPPSDHTLISPSLLEVFCFKKHAFATITESNVLSLTVKTDIYGLGALLRTLLLKGDPCLKRRFEPETFARELRKAASYTYRNQLSGAHQKRLCTIMNKAMQRNSGKGYARALDMANDLKKLIATMQNATIGTEEGTADDRMMTAAWVLQQHPVFKYQNNDAETNVLLMGDSPIVCDFFNLIFSCAQLPDGNKGFRPLNMHVLTHSPADFYKKLKKTGDLCRYLRLQRPENPNRFDEPDRTLFAKITMATIGSATDPNDAKALKQLATQFLGKEPTPNKAKNKKSATDKPNGKINQYTYILLLDENPDLNMSLAQHLLQRLRDEAPKLLQAKSVFIGVGDLRTSGIDPRTICVPKELPQITCQTFALNGITAETERAFRQRAEDDALMIHTYYTKEYQQRTGRQDIAQTFQNSENKLSSIRAVLSIPYKLYACNLLEEAQMNRALAALQATAPRSAQRQIRHRLSHKVQDWLDAFDSGKNPPELQLLLHLEHRSWQCFALTQGWCVATEDQLTKFAFTPENPGHKFYVEGKKFHSCLEESTFGNESRVLPLQTWSQQDWRNNLAGDALDRRSVFLHRLCCRRVEELEKNQAFEAAFRTLKQSIPADQSDAHRQVSSLIVVGQKLLLRQSQTDILWHQFCAKLALLLNDNTDALDALNALRKLMLPVLARNAYHDYKRTDLDLIRAMPMILHPHIVKTLYKLYSDTHWCNIVTATIAEPERLVLFYDPQTHDQDKVAEDARHYANFFRKRYTAVTGSNDTIRVECKPYLTGTLSSDSALDITGASPEFTHCALMRNSLRALPTVYYKHGKLHGLGKDGPDWNMYNGLSRSFNVEESLSLAKNDDLSAPLENDLLLLYRDYAALWQSALKIQISHWNAATTHIGQYASAEYPMNSLDELAPLTVKTSHLKQYGALTETRMRDLGLTDVLDQLVQKNVLSGYRLQNGILSVDSVATDFSQNNQNQIDRLVFYIGLDPDMKGRYALREVVNARNPKEPAFAIYDRCLHFITVVPDGHEFVKAMQAVNSKLPADQICNYVVQQEGNFKVIRFSFKSEAVRELLRKSGNILEVFAYHAISDSGLFDDIKPNVYICWFNSLEDSAQQTINEVDLICTKGMRTYYISCKRKTKLDQSCYDQVWCQAQLLGVDAVPILLWAGNENQGSATHIARGRRMGVETIWLNAKDAETGKKEMLARLREIVSR